MNDAMNEKREQAEHLTAAKKFADALALWKQVVAAVPGDLMAHQKMAELSAKLGHTAEAVKIYEALAARYAETGQFFKASAACRALLKLVPTHERTQALIASLYSLTQSAVAPGAENPPPRRASGTTPPAAKTERPYVDIDLGEAASVPSGEWPDIPLFSSLSRSELRDVLSTAMEVRAFHPAEVVVNEGEAGQSMFAVVEGVVGIYRGWGTNAQRRVAQIEPGDFFGEVAMVSGALRVATAVADGNVVVLEFPREAMQGIVSRHPRVGQQLEVFFRERLLANAMRASPILSLLSPSAANALAAQFKPCTFGDGHLIISESHPVEAVHMLLRGVCAATHHSGERYPDLREGDLFGEISVLSDGLATASVRTVGPALTMSLSAEAFKATVLATPEAEQAVARVMKERLIRTSIFDQMSGLLPTGDARV